MEPMKRVGNTFNKVFSCDEGKGVGGCVFLFHCAIMQYYYLQ
jgi:hypothetical protein